MVINVCETQKEEGSRIGESLYCLKRVLKSLLKITDGNMDVRGTTCEEKNVDLKICIICIKLSRILFFNEFGKQFLLALTGYLTEISKNEIEGWLDFLLFIGKYEGKKYLK